MISIYFNYVEKYLMNSIHPGEISRHLLGKKLIEQITNRQIDHIKREIDHMKIQSNYFSGNTTTDTREVFIDNEELEKYVKDNNYDINKFINNFKKIKLEMYMKEVELLTGQYYFQNSFDIFESSFDFGLKYNKSIGRMVGFKHCETGIRVYIGESQNVENVEVESLITCRGYSFILQNPRKQVATRKVKGAVGLVKIYLLFFVLFMNFIPVGPLG